MSGKLKILIPTDFSENAKQAADFAIRLFGTKDAEFRLINVYSEPHSSADMLVSIVDLLEKESIKELDKEVNRICEGDTNKALAVSSSSEYGELSQVIKKLVRTDSYDFVVMGTKGASGIKRVLLGSNTSHVIQQRICPVIAVPEDLEPDGLEKVVIAFDALAYSEKQFEPLEKLVNDYEAEFHLVHVAEKEVDVREKIHNLNGDLEAFTNSFEYEPVSVKNTDVVQGLLDYSHNENIDLLVMIHRKHNIFDRLFNDSVSKQIAMRSDMPILVLPEK
jgi:nucleotide-binding universal stress UspA family protein